MQDTNFNDGAYVLLRAAFALLGTLSLYRGIVAFKERRIILPISPDSYTWGNKKLFRKEDLRMNVYVAFLFGVIFTLFGLLFLAMSFNPLVLLYLLRLVGLELNYP